MQWSVLWHLRLKFIYNFHMHQRILLIRFADFTTKRTKWIKSWVVYVYITLDMSSLLWICLHIFDYVYITLSPLLWICLHYLCYDYIFFVYMYITMDMSTLHWVHLPCVVCLHVIQCAGEALSLSAGVVSGSLWFSIPPVRPVFIDSTSHSCVHLFRWMSVFVL